jgi:ribosomal protein S25
MLESRVTLDRETAHIHKRGKKEIKNGKRGKKKEKKEEANELPHFYFIGFKVLAKVTNNIAMILVVPPYSLDTAKHSLLVPLVNPVDRGGIYIYIYIY